jgi:hypothetical protein
MDPAAAISQAQAVVTNANLPADLQQAAFAQVLGYLLATADTSPSAPATPSAPQAGTWNQVTNTQEAAPAVPPDTSPSTPATPSAPGTGTWNQVTNTQEAAPAVPPVTS